MKHKFPRALVVALSVIALTCLINACAPMHVPTYSHEDPQTRPTEKRVKIISTAEQYLGRKYIKVSGKYFRNDCSGFARAVFRKNGVKLINPSNSKHQNLVKSIYDFVDSNGTIYRNEQPKPGDLVFFSHTYKKYGTNRFSHIGIVEKTYRDGTVAFIHKSSIGITRDYMNLKKPGKFQGKNGKVFNSYLRRKTRHDPPGIRYLAGELFEAYGSILD